MYTAASKKDWLKCIRATNDLERLTLEDSYIAEWRQYCGWANTFSTGGNPTSTDASNYYEALRRRIDEAYYAPGGLESIKGDVCRVCSG